MPRPAGGAAADGRARARPVPRRARHRARRLPRAALRLDRPLLRALGRAHRHRRARHRAARHGDPAATAAGPGAEPLVRLQPRGRQHLGRHADAARRADGRGGGERPRPARRLPRARRGLAHDAGGRALPEPPADAGPLARAGPLGRAPHGAAGPRPRRARPRPPAGAALRQRRLAVPARGGLRRRAGPHAGPLARARGLARRAAVAARHRRDLEPLRRAAPLARQPGRGAGAAGLPGTGSPQATASWPVRTVRAGLSAAGGSGGSAARAVTGSSSVQPGNISLQGRVIPLTYAGGAVSSACHVFWKRSRM